MNLPVLHQGHGWLCAFFNFPQNQITKWSIQNVKGIRTLFVAVRRVISGSTLTQKHTSVSNVECVDPANRKNRDVSFKLWQLNKTNALFVYIIASYSLNMWLRFLKSKSNNVCCVQVHQRQTLCVNVERTTTESTASVNPARSEYTNLKEYLVHSLFPPGILCWFYLKWWMGKSVWWTETCRSCPALFSLSICWHQKRQETWHEGWVIIM